jgi:hypothetical protein
VTQPGGSGDLIGDFQRWLLRSGARGMSRELADQVRAALGKNQSTGDVWETATTQPVPADAPECAWCPLCRAARIVREAKPGRDKRVAAVGDALTTVVQDAVSVLEAALAATGRSAGGNGRTEAAGAGTRGYPAAGAAGKAAPGGQATAPAPGGRAATPSSGGQATTPADSGQATTPADGGQAAAGPAAGPGGQAAPGSGGAAAGPGGQAPASADGPAAPGTDAPATSGTDGPAASGRKGPAAPEPPEESPHEPDDRG